MSVNVKEALVAAMAAPSVRARASGCGRAYVVFSVPKEERKAMGKALAAACKALGLMYLPKAYGVSGGPCIYMGYDNADGRALGKASAVADALKAAGFNAYMDAVSD